MTDFPNTFLSMYAKTGVYNKQMAEDLQVDNSRFKIPRVGMVVVDSITADGDVLCRPENWVGADFPPIFLQNATVQVGDHVLARIRTVSDSTYTAKIIKVIEHRHTEFLGVCEQVKNGFCVTSTDKRDKNMYFIDKADAIGMDTGAGTIGCADGDIVRATPIRGKTRLLKNAKLKYVLGNIKNAHSYSLLSILKHHIPDVFPEQVLQQTQNMTVPDGTHRVDLTHIPLVTIDGADARDFDDAVYAQKTDVGFKILVAIADVAHYVKPNTPLCTHALERGNSTYFADRVVPMLPEKLSNDLCSLIPHERRACMAVWIDIDTCGNIQKYTFMRGIMQSHARLTYEQVQAAQDGGTDGGGACANLLPCIRTLYDAYAALTTARQKRGTLELEVTEKYVVFDNTGHTSAIRPRNRLNSHRLIEEFMIAANVAAACALQDKSYTPIMYRIHDVPPLDKLESLQQALHTMGLSLPKGTHLTPHHFMRLLQRVHNTPHAPLVSELILRSQSQAQYSPENIGHFGLALQNYCHFTSPIRRYSDILVHRALIDAYKLGEDGMDAVHVQDFATVADSLCNTERRSQQAERETLDRYIADYMQQHINTEVNARITSVTAKAIFLTLTDTGADAVVFLKTLHWDYFIYSPENHAVIGERTHHTYTVGDPVVAEIYNISPIKGGIQCRITDGGSKKKITLPQKTGRHRRTGKPKRYNKKRPFTKNTRKRY